MGTGAGISVNTGTLALNVSGGSSIAAVNGGVTVASLATLQIAGSTSALSDSSTPSHVANVANSGTFTVTGTNQIVGSVNGSSTTNVNGATVYNGNTTVGTGSAADLTATQILQNSLTVGNGASVTIVPSASGGMVATAAATSELRRIRRGREQYCG